jgi:hypothetical protein
VGLSNEERYLKTYYVLCQIHKAFEPSSWAQEYYEREYRQACKKIQNTTEQLLGLLAQKMDRSSGYCLLGENDTGFRSLCRSSYFEARNEAFDESYAETLRKMREENGSHFDVGVFSERLGFSDPVKALAKWWDSWGLVPALLYPVFRYDNDDCFPKTFIKLTNQLIARIMLFKHVICGNGVGSDEVTSNSEQVLLWKYELFQKSFEKGFMEQFPDVLKSLRGLDALGKINKLKKMTQKQLAEEVKAIQDADYKSRYAKPEPGNRDHIDPVRGDMPSIEQRKEEFKKLFKARVGRLAKNSKLRKIEPTEQDILSNLGWEETVEEAVDEYIVRLKNKKGLK